MSYAGGFSGPGRAGLVVALVLVGVASAGATMLLGVLPTDMAAGAAVGLITVLVSIPLLLRAVSREIDPVVRRIILAAFALKLLAMVALYYISFVVYGGVADAQSYAEWGAALAPEFRNLHFAPDLGRPLVGTGFVRYVTGLVFVITGPTIFGGFIVFSWFAYWGLYGFLRAFQISFPDADHRRYAALVMLVPTMLFWPSSIGKEALVVAGLGLGTFGAARLFQRSLTGWPLVATGALLIGMIRPHVAAVFLAAAAAGFLFRGHGHEGRRPLFGPAGQLLGLALFAVVAIGAVRYTESHFGLEESTTSGNVTALLDETTERTERGGSEFDHETVSSPLDMPGAAMTVLFRPWPHEAENPQQLLTSFESLILLGVAMFSWRRILAGLRRVATIPLLRMSFAFTLLFIFAFSAVGNFGILARQRAQVLPFALVFLALPYAIPRRRSTPGVPHIEAKPEDVSHFPGALTAPPLGKGNEALDPASNPAEPTPPGSDEVRRR